MNEYRVLFGLERWSNKKQKSNSQNVFEVDVSGFVIVGKFMQLTVNVKDVGEKIILGFLCDSL